MKEYKRMAHFLISSSYVIQIKYWSICVILLGLKSDRYNFIWESMQNSGHLPLDEMVKMVPGAS